MSSRRMNRFIFIVAGCCSVLTGCMKWDYDLGREIAVRPEVGHGLFITNEGNFQYGNATLSFYDTQTRKIDNEVFFRANDQKLGDVAQSMTMYGGLGWIVVNNSHVIFAIDPVTFKEVGRITNLTSPRYIHFLSDEKAYVTQIWDNRIFIVNPKRFEITGYIDCPGMTMETGSTEQMVQYGKYVYVNCWSYQNRLLKIDTETDKVVDELVVGIQPTSLVMDKYDKMWTITDGGYEGSPLRARGPLALPYRRRNFQDRKTVQIQIRRLALGGAAQRRTRHALLHQQRYLADAGGGRSRPRAAVPQIQADEILRPVHRPQHVGSIRGRRHRLPTEGDRLPLFARRRVARRIPGGNYSGGFCWY